MKPPEYSNRWLTEMEAEAYAALIARKLPQFEVFRVPGAIDLTGAVYIGLPGPSRDDPTLLCTPNEVTNFINFLEMQEELQKRGK